MTTAWISKRTAAFRLVAATALVGVALAGAPESARAGNAAEAGWGIGSALASLAYGPVKLGYAAVGVVFGGVSWGLSGGDPYLVDTVIAPAVRGDYVVTPSHLRGERKLVFVGPVGGTDPSRVARDAPEPEPDPWAYEY